MRAQTGIKNLQGSGRGFQVYPQKAGQVHCNDPEDEDDDNVAVSDFLWSPDSSKVVFADVKSGAISLILVTMPVDRKDFDKQDNDKRDQDSRDLPRTSVYTFVGAEDVCAGAAYCNNYYVRSVAWSGEAVAVALIQANPGGTAIEKDLTIPLSKFVPIGK